MRPADELERLKFDCPRCGEPAEERFWGPCSPCREELAVVQKTAAQEGEAAPESGARERFEPTMHVVPNHVATKD